jgi:uncharacterized membrane protein YkvA (DUF1232 family)
MNWRAWAKKLKTEIIALYLAYRDPRTPWYARVVIGLVVVYAFSPIDLIPDFIPVLGYLDDMLLLPLGIALAIRLLPDVVLAECREQAREYADQPTYRAAALVIIGFWILIGIGVVRWLSA